MIINLGDIVLLKEKATSSQNGADNITVEMTSTEPSSQPEKTVRIIRLVEWTLRLSSIILCSATLTVGIYLEVTKDNVVNRGGPIPLIYIAVSWHLITVFNVLIQSETASNFPLAKSS